MFCFFKLFIFLCGFSAPFLIRLMFQGYHCKSGIAIFAMEGHYRLRLQPLQKNVRGFSNSLEEIRRKPSSANSNNVSISEKV